MVGSSHILGTLDGDSAAASRGEQELNDSASSWGGGEGGASRLGNTCRKVNLSRLTYPSRAMGRFAPQSSDELREGRPRRVLKGVPGCSAVPRTKLEPGRYVAIAGNIGSGKTSLVDFMAARYGVEPFGEPNDDNPYLADFYQDMERWALHSQLFFLTHKLRIHREIENGNQPALLDRTIYEDAEIFAVNLHKMGRIDARDFITYWNLYQNLAYTIRPPSLMIYLRCPVRDVRRRIRFRGREMEQKVPVEYLQRLNKLYEQWFTSYDLSPVLVLNTGKLDYVTDLVDRLDVIESLDRSMASIMNP